MMKDNFSICGFGFYDIINHNSTFLNGVYSNNSWLQVDNVTSGGGCSFPIYINYSDDNVSVNVVVNNCEGLNSTSAEVNEDTHSETGAGITLEPATDEDMRGKNAAPAKSLEVIYDDA